MKKKIKKISRKWKKIMKMINRKLKERRKEENIWENIYLVTVIVKMKKINKKKWVMDKMLIIKFRMKNKIKLRKILNKTNKKLKVLILTKMMNKKNKNKILMTNLTINMIKKQIIWINKIRLILK